MSRVTFAMAVAALIVVALASLQPHAADACSYATNRNPGDWVRRADAIVFATAGEAMGEVGAAPIEVDRWLFGGTTDPMMAMVPSEVCWGPNALRAGVRYLLFLREPDRGGLFAGTWTSSPMATYAVADDRLTEVGWESRGDSLDRTPGLVGLTESEAVAALEPYVSFRAALLSPQIGTQVSRRFGR